MSALARIEIFESVAILPPAFNLTTALAFVSNVQDFARAVADLETQAAIWRAKTLADFRKEELRVREIASAASPEEVASVLLPRLQAVRATVSDAFDAMPMPPSQMPIVIEKMETIRGLAPDLARFFRKLLKRADTARLSQMEALSSLHDRLLALELDFDPEARATPDSPSFTDADDLIAYLNS